MHNSYCVRDGMYTRALFYSNFSSENEKFNVPYDIIDKTLNRIFLILKAFLLHRHFKINNNVPNVIDFLSVVFFAVVFYLGIGALEECFEPIRVPNSLQFFRKSSNVGYGTVWLSVVKF